MALSRVDTIYRHASNRLQQRFGMTLTKDMEHRIVCLIRAGKTSFVKDTSNRVSVHRVKIGDLFAKVAYDKIRKRIITFIPIK